MGIQAALKHVTRYRYDRPIALGAQTIRLRPAPHCRAKVTAYSLTIEPETHFINWQQDPQSNWLARIVVPEKTDHFTISVDLTVDMEVINPFDFFLEPDAEQFPFAYSAELKAELEPYLQPLPGGPAFDRYLAGISREKKQTTSFIFDLNARLAQDIAYLIRMEPGIQTPEDTLCKGSGSCRDSAWLLVQLLRHMGLAARFASGYLIQLKPDVKSLDGPSGPEQDFTDLHAWCEVYLPGAGWVGLDPTSGLFAGEGHIPLACTANPIQAAPISGAVEPSEVLFDFDMRVTRIKEPPRVTKPYTDEQWAEIENLGDAVDQVLRNGDVRLTMGGEPTFVSVDDRSGAEWHTAAVGPTKRALADTLIRRLRDRFAPGGLLHYGQGKWYPGESLPRWAFALYWRADGVPLWKNPKRIAAEGQDYKPSLADARALIDSIAATLGLDASYAIPAYEDFWHHLAQERQLAANVDPRDSKLEDPELRARLARVFERGLSNAVGFVLPLEKGVHRWLSEHWTTRSGHLFLLPGDSSIGFRLPLNALPYVPQEARTFVPPPDPFAPLPPLETRDQSGQNYTDKSHANGSGPGRIPSSPASPFRPINTEVTGLVNEPVVRTALTVEPRDGRLCVFMPPTFHAGDYFALLAAVEASAEKLGQAVHIEGYPPPFDPRIHVIKVTPDPGVIEVNIHPARSWREQVDITRALYEEAHACRLSTEKFQLDGRHTGTGGGNHIVVGAANPPDSPFLRRPDLLKSILAYWQNHPALSYLFSGLFIGPTSQAPRIDEARHDSLYELEIAFSEIPPRSAVNLPPWLVDRVFRNLLADSTGNTHRTEICIDKLYSPDGPTGRLGLVEFRNFEMPPHAEMSLAQSLLLRALIARFWREPYQTGLVRWGTSLHDRFLLPHFVWADFADVIADLNAHGFAFDLEWFRPHWEFRFPHIGSVQYEGVGLELRNALEPWNVMGEEAAAGGTVRFVDSSVERLQVKATGLTQGRHRVLVNGRTVPLRATAQGEAVAGVRFKAWQPAHGLHPTIPAHGPLVLEIWDGWRKRSLGGCTYHVAHPGGRNFEIFPVNANEAEGRRLARFEPFGFTGGVFDAAKETSNPDFPYTLDLRRGV
ncbi:MAG TPA: transglutaminase family protein [Rhizomicrobium sp.]|nr:transglutaminase family protein [Rhizomicrobium sp.]